MEAAPQEPSPRALAALREAADAVTALRRAEARCYTALHTLAADDVAAETGHRSTRRLVEEHLRLDPADARRRLRHAQALSPALPLSGGDPAPPALPATADALAAGTLGSGHIAVIDRTMRRVDRLAHVDPATRAVTEQQLAALAGDRTPAALADAATEILALLDPDGAAPTDRDVPDHELHIVRRRDGSLVGKFRYTDPAAAELIATALDHATPAATADGDLDTRLEPLRTLPERRAQALLDLTTHAVTRGLDHPDIPEPDDTDQETDDETETAGSGDPTVDQGHDDGANRDDPHQDDSDQDAQESAPPSSPARRLPDTEGGERVHVAVTVDWDLLRRQLARSGQSPPLLGLAHLGSGHPIGPETARRLACDAEIIPTVLGSRSEPLDVGRRTRIVPPAMRRALVLRDRHCAHPGCRRRARRCAAHHIRHWAHGGPTELENLVLLCAYHHALAHHGGWTITVHDGLPWFTPPGWLDPHRRPRHNRPWHYTEQPPSTAAA